MASRALQRKPGPFAAAIHALSARSDPACLLDTAGTILFVNDAWERSAREHGVAERCGAAMLVGSRLVDHVAGEEPRRVISLLVARALQRRPGEGPVVLTSENNGPDVARLVATRVEPVRADGGLVVGVSLVHALVRERPAAEVYAPVDAGEREWRSRGGVLEQCSCCRRTRRPDAPEDWDFVPGLVAATPTDAAFVHCPLCRELHVPGGLADADGPSASR